MFSRIMAARNSRTAMGSVVSKTEPPLPVHIFASTIDDSVDSTIKGIDEIEIE